MIKSITEVTPYQTGNKLEWFDEQYKKSFIDLTKKPPPPQGLISIGTETYLNQTSPNYIFTKGELSVISAPSKTFKSTFKSQLAGLFFKGESKQFADWKGHRQQGETVIDIDSEQGINNAWRTFNRTKRACRGVDINGYYYPFKLRHMMPEQRVDFIDLLLESGRIQKPALMFIDGIADLIDDSNDLRMSNYIMAKVMNWTDTYNMHVNVIIHNAYGTKKATGHLGSATVKKGETVLNLQEVMDEQLMGLKYFRVVHQYSRGATVDDFYFKNDKNIGMVKQVDENGDDINGFDTF